MPGIHCNHSSNISLYHQHSDIRIIRTVEIPFASHKHATIAKQAIDVDAELNSKAVKRTLVVEDEVLKAYAVLVPSCSDNILNIHYNRTFETLTVRLARLTINGFLENIDLVARTLEQYAEEADK